MTRLNFDHLLAEEPNMNKEVPFLIMIILLLSGFYITYKTAEFQYSGAHFEKQKNQQLVRQLEQLQLKEKVAQIEKENLSRASGLQRNSRSIASISHVTKNQMAVKPTKFDANKELMDSASLAESFYRKAKLNCEKYKKEDVCTKNIEIVITQFPETRWAGESLLLLGRLYLKTRHTERAREVLQIVKREFKDDKEIQLKLSQMERSKK